MVENYVQIPDDSTNTGKKIRSNQRTVSGNTVEEHFMILQDYIDNYQAKIDSSGHLFTVGSITSMPTITIGSVSAIVDSVYIQSGDNINLGTTWTGIGSVLNTNLYPGSKVYQGTAPWIINGSVNVNNYSNLGSNRIITNFSELGSSRIITAGSIQVVNPYNGSVTSLPNITINSPSTIGSLANQNITGSIINQQVSPVDSSQNNPHYTMKYIISGTSTGITGSRIGSIIQYIGTGSFVSVLTYSNDLLVNIGSWT